MVKLTITAVALIGFIQGSTTTGPSGGVYTEEQGKRGQAKYAEACSRCHQSDLAGADQAPSLAGGDFLDRWQGQSVGDLADRIRTTMPQDDVGSLNIQTSADITAY